MNAHLTDFSIMLKYGENDRKKDRKKQNVKNTAAAAAAKTIANAPQSKNTQEKNTFEEKRSRRRDDHADRNQLRERELID